MKVKFVGGAGRITGSCHWLVHEKTGLQLLVDCGIIQGGIWEAGKQPPFPFAPKQINAVILTHAHIDHCGRIPELFERGFRGKILCTRPTAELTTNNLEDGMSKQPRQQAGQNQKFLVWLHQAFKCQDEHPNFNWNKTTPIDDDVFVGFSRSSHLLGAAGAIISWTTYLDGELIRKSACFSGDIGTVLDAGGESNDINPHPLLKRTQVPHENTDYIVMESTYGNECRDEKYGKFDLRINALREVISHPKFNTIVFPTFSMGRTQDILFDILYLVGSVMPESKFKIYMDSPLGIRATFTYMRALQKYSHGYLYRNDEVARRFYMSEEETEKSRQLKKAEKSADNPAHQEVDKFMTDIGESARNAELARVSKNDNKSKLCLEFSGKQIRIDTCKEIPATPANGEKQIIITSSGMLQGGPVLNHLERLAKGTCAFVISGYQGMPIGKYLCKVAQLGQAQESEQNAEPKTQPDFIVEREENSPDEKLVLHTNKIKGLVFDLGGYYSGHADREGLMRYLFKSKTANRRQNRNQQPQPN